MIFSWFTSTIIITGTEKNKNVIVQCTSYQVCVHHQHVHRHNCNVIITRILTLSIKIISKAINAALHKRYMYYVLPEAWNSLDQGLNVVLEWSFSADFSFSNAQNLHYNITYILNINYSPWHLRTINWFKPKIFDQNLLFTYMYNPGYSKMSIFNIFQPLLSNFSYISIMITSCLPKKPSTAQCILAPEMLICVFSWFSSLQPNDAHFVWSFNTLTCNHSHYSC